MDHYEILGVKSSATKRQLKEAFKKQALKFHPDKHTESSKEYATSKFKEVSEAYEVLTNDLKRAEYDSRCGYGKKGNRGGVGSTSSATASFYRSGDFHGCKERCRNRYRYGGGGALGFDTFVRFLSSPVALSIAFASALVATTFIFENRRERLCKMHDCGKSYEEAIEWPGRGNLRQHYRARHGANHTSNYYYNYPPRCDE